MINVNSMRQYPVEMASDDLHFSSIVLESHSPSILPAQDRDWQSTEDEHPAQHAIRRVDGYTEWQPLIRRIPSRRGIGRTVGRPISGWERAVPADSRVGVSNVAVGCGVEGEGENES
jgi:chromatin segregation and condensation protein Rec8/ScpA/Scc1 (kleisin family)